MPQSYNPYRDDDADDNRREDVNPSEDPGDIPASVAFMEMMRQAAARSQLPVTPEAPLEDRAALISSERRARRGGSMAGVEAAAAALQPIQTINHAGDDASPAQPGQVRRVRRKTRRTSATTPLGGVLRSIIIILVAAGLTATILTWFTPQQQLRQDVRDELSAALATSEFATFAPTAQPTPNWLKQIGIVSGHRGGDVYDPGAVCTDAAGSPVRPNENDINFSVATLVVDNLRAMGYSVDLLDEFDPRLDNYQAAALVSIHANTCTEWPGNEVVSGFLIAGPAARTSMRGNDELLVGCIADHYHAMTELVRRPGVTRDMTHYHNFREIHPLTPAAILELGFMRADWDLLSTQPDLMARAVTNGVLCFVDPGLAPTRPAPAAGL
jgi:N-acetylmuramoyl-L-alanine amidase